MNALKENFKESIFMIGKNQVMQIALDKLEEEEKKKVLLN